MKREKPIAALFDFDGVVMDTEPQYSIFWGEQGRKFHPEIEHFELIIKGQTLQQIFDKHFTGMTEVQLQICRELDEYEKRMDYQYITGIENFAKTLKNQGVKTAVVTSSNNKKMECVYQTHPELTELFDRILTADMFARSKPNPDCFLLGAEVFDTVPENCLVFEDSFHGIEAGKRAGMTVIALATTNPTHTLIDKAHEVIENFSQATWEDVEKWINKN